MLSGYRGHVDAIEPALTGWVGEIARPLEPVRFVVSMDGEPLTRVVADRVREDVAAAGLAAATCGFSLPLPPHLLDGAEHRIALLLPDGRSLDLPGLPVPVALGPVPIDLVPAGAASLDAVLDLLRQNDREAGFDPVFVSRADAAVFDASHRPEQGFVFYARAGSRLVGYGRLDRGRSDTAGVAIVALTVLAAYRRKGLGEALLRALLQAAVSCGLRQVWLSVRTDNAPAQRLYDKLGFVCDPEHPPGPWAVPGELTMVWLPPAGARV